MIDQVQREIRKLEVFRTLRVSVAAEFEICRILTLYEVKPNDMVIHQGDIGDTFYVRNPPTTRKQLRILVDYNFKTQVQLTMLTSTRFNQQTI